MLKNIAGFSLVEVMVAMVIGLLGLIVMMQVFALFEGQKRTTTGGSDAQNGGAIALYGVQRDLQQSGFGTSAFSSLGCSLTLPAGTSGITLNSLAPVTINYGPITGLAGQDPNTDTLLVVYSESNSPIEGNGITTQLVQNQYAVQTATSFQVGDYVYALPKNRPTPCNLALEKVGSITLPSTVNVPTGRAGVVNGALFDLGQTVKILAYAIRGGNLTVCDYMVNDCSSNSAAFWVPIASDIVSLKAEYGRDTAAAPMTGIIDTWDRAALAGTSCALIRVSAIRIGIVARSSQFEKTAVTTAAPQWYGSVGNPINLTTTNANWQNYRYKVFQTIVPLRNITWMLSQGVSAGC